jgi:NAD(P)-dependent dehydrogenase (short-subunit alcohol dehydrogenase family)
MRLEGKIAIITGANGEFGSAIVPGFAKEGCQIACADWTRADADKAAEKVRAAGQRALALEVDLRESSQVDALVQRVVDEFGRIDILVNTTARPHHQEFLNFKEEDFDDTLARGVKTYFLTCKAVAQQMVKQRAGKIVNLTSIVSKLGPGQAVDWSADRGAVDGLTRSVAHALGFYGITVNGVARGNTARPPYSVGVQERIRRLPFGRTEHPGDMVEPCIFLATDASRYVTGTVLYVDGGYTVAAVTDDRFRPDWAKAGAEWMAVPLPDGH